MIVIATIIVDNSPFFLQKVTNNVAIKFIVDDTIPQFRISIEQDN